MFSFQARSCPFGDCNDLSCANGRPHTCNSCGAVNSHRTKNCNRVQHVQQVQQVQHVVIQQPAVLYVQPHVFGGQFYTGPSHHGSGGPQFFFK